MNKLKLTIELVPESSWLNNVRAVLTSKQWNIIKKQVFAKAWDTCEICGGIGPKHPVECHEIWHYDDKTLIQKLTGMIALCPKCHMVKHIRLAQIRNKKEEATLHFMKINKIKRQEAEKYIIDAFRKWNERSNNIWKLDISILKEYDL